MLLREAGHHVSGSDPSPRPPMSEVLAARGIEVVQGWRPANLDPLPRETLVVVGNVCRRDNPEAVRAAELGLRRLSMPGAIAELLLPGRRSLVIAGTHGKTTTTALLASILLRAGADPTVLIGGVSRDLGGSSRLGGGPFLVIEGDEYDSAFFEKVPKFWSYRPEAAAISSVEHDHLDIYPDEASYEAAFAGFIERIDPEGMLVVWAGDDRAVALAGRAPCRVLRYGLDTDSVSRSRGSEPAYTASLRADPGRGPYRLVLRVRDPGGVLHSLPTPLAGRHNARNTLAAIAVCREVCGLTWEQIGEGVARFGGVALRQERIGTRRSIRVYRDFAHHPRAVAETISALRPLAWPGRLVAAFEPRSATACRRIHQREYVRALALADEVVLAPVGRPEIPDEERLDTGAIARELRGLGLAASSTETLDQTLELLLARLRPGDLALLMSNGHFGGIDRELLERLRQR